MKLGLVFAALSLVACAKATTHVAKHPATPDECNAVYDNLLSIAVHDANLRFQLGLAKKDDEEAKHQLDMIWRAEGKSEKFFISCQATANNEQTACMSHAETFDGVDACAKLLK